MQDRFVVVKIVEVVVDDILASEHLPHSLLNSVTIESHGQNLCPQEDQDSKAERHSPILALQYPHRGATFDNHRVITSFD